jgi:hypothetical protein
MAQVRGTLSQHSRWAPRWWLLVLRVAVPVSSANIYRLGWHAQLVAWPVVMVILVCLAVWGRSVGAAAAPPVPNASDLVAADPPASGRASDLSALPAVRAAGSNTFGDVFRNSARARSWHPAGDPEADREALLAGQAFRVTALLKVGERWGYGRLEIGGQPLTVTWRRAPAPLVGPFRAKERNLPLMPPARIVLTRPVDLAHGRFPSNDLIFTVATIRTQDARHVLAIPTLDVPLVHTALELANAEYPRADSLVEGGGDE